MNRFDSITSAFLVAAFLGLFGLSADAQEIYKWTDANGTVHYGDRAAAPDSSKKMNITVAPPSQPPVVSASALGAQRRPPLPNFDSEKKSVPADPALVGPECKGLIEKIAAVPPGKNWEGLSRQFNSACPGIAYDCVEYRSNPQKNQCIWVERSGGFVLNRNKYP